TARRRASWSYFSSPALRTCRKRRTCSGSDLARAGRGLPLQSEALSAIYAGTLGTIPLRHPAQGGMPMQAAAHVAGSDGLPFPFSYRWPKLPGLADAPLWTGRGFRVGKKLHRVLSYGVQHSNWTDELPTFHEETAGGRHFIDRASRRHALGQVKRFVH